MIQFFIIQKLILIYGILVYTEHDEKYLHNLIIREDGVWEKYGQQTILLPPE